MNKRPRTAESKRVDTPLDLSHLRREARTALELAIVALAPTELVDRLAAVAGLIEALIEFPPDSLPAVTLLPKVAARGRGALNDWHEWEKKNLPKGLA